MAVGRKACACRQGENRGEDKLGSSIHDSPYEVQGIQGRSKKKVGQIFPERHPNGQPQFHPTFREERLEKLGSLISGGFTVLVFTMAFGCSSPEPPNGTLHCGSQPAPCPSGYTCDPGSQTCWKNGTHPLGKDSGAEVSDATVTDTTPTDAAATGDSFANNREVSLPGDGVQPATDAVGTIGRGDSAPGADVSADAPGGGSDTIANKPDSGPDVVAGADAGANVAADAVADAGVDADATFRDSFLAADLADGPGGDRSAADGPAQDAPCIPEDNQTFCTRLAKQCGQFAGTDNCGVFRTVASCGTCTGVGQTCAGAGVPNTCGVAPGTVYWARSLSTTFILGVAESSTGVMVSTSLTGPADLGDPGKPQLLAPVGGADTVLAQFAIGDATYQFSSKFGASSPAGTDSVYGFVGALSSGDAPMVAGVSSCDPNGTPACNQIDVGAGLVTPGGGPGADGFVGRYSLTSGKAAWIKRLFGPEECKILAVANGPGSSVLAAGSFSGTATLSGGSDAPLIFTSLGYRDILLAQFDAYTGSPGTTIKTYGGAGDETPFTIAWTGSKIVMAGEFNGTLTFGSTVLTSMDYDPWVAMFASDGTPIWADRFGGPTKEAGGSAVVDVAGDVYMTGPFAGTVAFGSFTLKSAGGQDVFVVKLRGSDGVVLWADSIGSTGDDSSANLAVNSSGQLLVAANVAGPIQVGGSSFRGQDAAFIAYDSSDGRLRWTKVIGTSDTDYAWTAATGNGVFYAVVNPGGDPGTTVDGVPIFGAPKASGLLLKIQP